MQEIGKEDVADMLSEEFSWFCLDNPERIVRTGSRGEKGIFSIRSEERSSAYIPWWQRKWIFPAQKIK